MIRRFVIVAAAVAVVGAEIYFGIILSRPAPKPAPSATPRATPSIAFPSPVLATTQSSVPTSTPAPATESSNPSTTEEPQTTTSRPPATFPGPREPVTPKPPEAPRIQNT